MIIDKIENINKYIEVPQNVSDFLKNLKPDATPQRHIIDETVYANIDIYDTKSIEICKFEAHKKYIDIQMLLEGTEKLDYIPVDNLKISEEYDEQRDVMFFENPQKQVDSVILEPYKFAFIYPHEAHKPQINANQNSQKVKKVVVKILVK